MLKSQLLFVVCDVAIWLSILQEWQAARFTPPEANVDLGNWTTLSLHPNERISASPSVVEDGWILAKDTNGREGWIKQVGGLQWPSWQVSMQMCSSNICRMWRRHEGQILDHQNVALTSSACT